MFTKSFSKEKIWSSKSKSDDKIMDRFIPSNASQSVYKLIPSEVQLNPQIARRLGIQTIRDQSIFNLNETSVNEGSLSLSLSTIPDHSNSSSSTPFSQDSHRHTIADALDFTPQHRVFSFTPSPNNKSRKAKINDYKKPNPSSTAGTSPSSSLSTSLSMVFTEFELPRRGSLDSETIFDGSLSTNNRSPTKSKKQIRSNIPYRVLDAPCLRNDFYSNLVSWSQSSNKVAVGLSSHVYVWSEEDGASLLDLPNDQLISCVSFSDYEYVAVASKNGRISVFSQYSQYLIDEFNNSGKGICCIDWVPNVKNRFFVGDETGDVLCLEITGNNLHLIKQFKCHQQQVCGIAVSFDAKQISVGGNDNCCTIWDIEDIENPKMKFFLPHQAAVKAIAYCPWSKSLLATGGGSKDRTIRFWHTNSGTLLESVPTKGQITSLIWSRRKKQIVVTFGFGDSQKPTIISMYSYPKMDVLLQVEATSNLRILSAVLSPDTRSICVAANDETVRFYELWDLKDSVILESHEDGMFGSQLIELCEGITKSGGYIR
ncbi:hypothetical protein WICMUC_005793 [Wickerhamomyces mucosus]|uniref:CDC20/Fizzy WD40 domain-containing protein n=1 Tax=Wickerhamomyces mucosus TaxID=1378264 RepID=A0A9P8P2K8_9ASCO|nr:hypothetical protein WICMUC_005793 [Wickerhamomyces mucosus]